MSEGRFTISSWAVNAHNCFYSRVKTIPKIYYEWGRYFVAKSGFTHQLIVRLSEWLSTKLVEYESLRVSNGRVRVGSSSSKMVKCESNMRVYSTKYQYFQRRIPCDYWNSRVRVGSSSSKMVECESNMRVSKYSVIHYPCFKISHKNSCNAFVPLSNFDESWEK